MVLCRTATPPDGGDDAGRRKRRNRPARLQGLRDRRRRALLPRRPRAVHASHPQSLLPGLVADARALVTEDAPAGSAAGTLEGHGRTGRTPGTTVRVPARRSLRHGFADLRRRTDQL